MGERVLLLLVQEKGLKSFLAGLTEPSNARPAGARLFV